MSGHETEKAIRYIGLLETARLNGNWAEIPELVRKVEKHAPSRRCLTLTATTEAQIASADKVRPPTASSTASHGSLLDATPQLVQAIDSEKQYPEDAFQATACLQHVYFLRKEWKTIIGSLQHDLANQVASIGKRPSDTSGYTRVCVVKSRYFLAFAHEQEGSLDQARQIYDSAIQYTNSTQGDIAASSEYRLWTERLLSRACSLEMGDSDISTISQATSALLRFRDWTSFWDRGTRTSVAASMSYDMPKRLVWGRYYRLLSSLLAAGLVVTDSKTSPISSANTSMSDEALTSNRRKQRAELKRVEVTYETLLLEETRFPKASQSNTEVEFFVERAVKNWRIFNGSFWREADLGEGGKEAVTRGVLDILYRAATKTFHSTSILRQLFSVHAALTEFDLAIKAFDSYTEFIEKGKARAEKTGRHEVGLDSDDVVLFTAAEAIDVLCTYGAREQAEKALEVGRHVAKWLHQQPPKSRDVVDVTDGDEAERLPEDSSASVRAIAAAHRAIGQSEANWARYTYEPRQRTEMQQLAIKSFREATNALQGQADPDTAYLFAYVLAETRDTISAVQVLKTALASIPSESTSASDGDMITVQRKSIPLWHLMALLLTAKGDYDTATRMCEAACEQFAQIARSMSQAGGHGESSSTEDDAGLNGLSAAFLGQLDESEKETLLQIKMTELDLLTLMESPSTAVNKSNELFALYAKLFGDPTVKSQQLQSSLSTNTLDTRKSTGGTLKSFRGSILGRPKSTHQSVDAATKYDTTPLPDNASVITRQRAATIGANGDNSAFASPDHGPTSEKHHKHHLPHIPHPHFHHHDHKESAGTTTVSQGNQTHMSEKIGSNDGQPPQMPPKEDLNGTSHRQPGVLTVQDAPPQRDAVTRPDQPFPHIPHNLGGASQPAPMGHSDQPPTQDLRLPAPHPASSAISAPRFPSAQDRRHRISLLVAVWLFVADLYMREELLDDAKGAIDEAEKLAQGFQADLAQEESSARAFNERGWGAGSSVARLWADMWAERGNLALQLKQPYTAIQAFDQALSHFPDHPTAMIQLSTLLLDIYTQTLPAEAPSSTPSMAPSHLTTRVPSKTSTEKMEPITSTAAPPASTKTHTPTLAPAELNRLAARDRAYLLLSTLTKLGEGWDCAEAWFVLSRYYELSGQVEKSRECLWWVVELEDSRPVRRWEVTRQGMGVVG